MVSTMDCWRYKRRHHIACSLTVSTTWAVLPISEFPPIFWGDENLGFLRNWSVVRNLYLIYFIYPIFPAPSNFQPCATLQKPTRLFYLVWIYKGFQNVFLELLGPIWPFPYSIKTEYFEMEIGDFMLHRLAALHLNQHEQPMRRWAHRTGLPTLDTLPAISDSE